MTISIQFSHMIDFLTRHLTPRKGRSMPDNSKGEPLPCDDGKKTFIRPYLAFLSEDFLSYFYHRILSASLRILHKTFYFINHCIALSLLRNADNNPIG